MKLPSVDDVISAVKYFSPVLRFFKRRVSSVDIVTDGKRFAVQKSGIIAKVWLDTSGRYWVNTLAVADRQCFFSSMEEAKRNYVNYKSNKNSNASLPTPSLSLKIVAGL